MRMKTGIDDIKIQLTNFFDLEIQIGSFYLHFIRKK